MLDGLLQRVRVLGGPSTVRRSPGTAHPASAAGIPALVRSSSLLRSSPVLCASVASIPFTPPRVAPISPCVRSYVGPSARSSAMGKQGEAGAGSHHGPAPFRAAMRTIPISWSPLTQNRTVSGKLVLKVQPSGPECVGNGCIGAGRVPVGDVGRGPARKGV